ncbi:hypothetical protein VULLAG_LOCUS13331 [Vulpes lagopus]
MGETGSRHVAVGLGPQALRPPPFVQGSHPLCLTSSRPLAGGHMSLAPGRCPMAVTWTSLWLPGPKRSLDGGIQALGILEASSLPLPQVYLASCPSPTVWKK